MRKTILKKKNHRRIMLVFQLFTLLLLIQPIMVNAASPDSFWVADIKGKIVDETGEPQLRGS